MSKNPLKRDPELPRFICIEGSASNHDCCFSCTLVDTHIPGVPGHGLVIAECADSDIGTVIAAMLNKVQELAQPGDDKPKPPSSPPGAPMH